MENLCALLVRRTFFFVTDMWHDEGTVTTKHSWFGGNRCGRLAPICTEQVTNKKERFSHGNIGRGSSHSHGRRKRHRARNSGRTGTGRGQSSSQLLAEQGSGG